MVDRGLTHVALPVRHADTSIDFYRRYAGMTVVHRRTDRASGRDVVWLSDLTRPFVIVLIETGQAVEVTLGGWAHLGVGCESREDVDRLAAEARAGGLTVRGPVDSGEPVGYWAFVADPDGHNLELSYGQEVGLTVRQVVPEE